MNGWRLKKVKRLSNRSEQMFATAQPLPIHQELLLKHLRTTVTETTMIQFNNCITFF